MKLINFQGLTCHTNSMVSIAQDMGIDWPAAFRALWSERDFYYQPDRKAYLSVRLPATLEALGVKLITQLCDSPDQAEALLSQLEAGEPVILGMDAFYVPWSQFFGLFHGPHFFALRYTGGDRLLCFDPTYDKAGMQLSRADVIAHAYDISRMLPVAPSPAFADPFADARIILKTHSETLRMLLEQAERCEKERSELPAKYVDTLINNRYLYRHYLEHVPAPYANQHVFMDAHFFSNWVDVKNGLYKAQISKDNQAIITKVCALLHRLMDMELTMAARMIAQSEQDAMK